MEGRKFIAALLQEKDGAKRLLEIDPPADWFIGSDQEVFEVVVSHVKKFGAFPQTEALKTIELPSVTETPLYYVDRLRKRYLHHHLAKGMEKAASQLNEDNQLASFETLKEAVATTSAAAAGNIGSPNAKLIDASELWSLQLKEPNWIVPGILPTGLTILAGKPKCGKSWLVYDIALSMAVGGEVLGSSVAPAPALMLALEDTAKRLQSRMRTLLIDQQPPSNTLHLMIDCQGGVQELRSIVANHPEVRLVVVDTFARFRPKSKGNSDIYGKDYEDVAALKAVADEFELSLVVVHHTRKAASKDPFEEVSGTLGITGGADSIMVLKREPNTDYGTLHIRGRDIQERSIGLRFEAGKWRPHGEFVAAPNTQQSNIMHLIDQADAPLSPKQLAELTGGTPDAMRKLVDRMVDKGFIAKIGHGQYASVTEEQAKKSKYI